MPNVAVKQVSYLYNLMKLNRLNSDIITPQLKINTIVT